MPEEVKISPAVIIPIGLGLGLVGAVGLYALAQAAPAPEGAKIKIEILDAEGHPVPHNSPVSLLEGESYTVRLTITNLSTKAGEPWGTNLDVMITAFCDYTTLITITRATEYFAAGEAIIFDYPMAVPLGTGGQAGQIVVRVFDPEGNLVAEGIEPLTVETIEIIYGATIVIGA